MLKDLQAERNLYEMRQYFPLKHDIFGEEGKKDILEHWNEDKLDKWKSKYLYHTYFFKYISIYYTRC